MAGILYGISVGPGDSELMTLKAVRLLEAADIIAVPRTKGEKTMALSIIEKVVNVSEKTIVFVDFLMTQDVERLEANYDRITDELIPYLESGRNIAMPNIGDISIYSTFSYIGERMMKRGYQVEVCAGVPSFCAMAAKVKKPLVAGKNALMIFPVDHENFQQLMEQKSEKIIMKAGRRLEDLKCYLEENGLADTIHIGMDIGLPTEQIATLDTINTDENSYFTTVWVKAK